MTFDTLGLHQDLLLAIQDLGFTEPTPIQIDAIPPAMEGRDLLACAMTGSGKTAAFLLPTLDYLLEEPKRATRALVLTPTRELAAQVTQDFRDLARHTKLEAVSIYGGVGMAPQERALRNKVDMVVACPGRLLDHLQRPYASLRDIEVLILDEADRMLDMGFLPDIRRILKHIPEARQTLFLSATMPRAIGKLASEMLHDPVSIAVDRQSKPADGVRQRIYPIPQKQKAHLLLNLLGDDKLKSVLAFTRTKHRANRLTAFLEKNGVGAARIHGNRSQAQREKALAAFRRGEARILVATDIAARGIDIDQLSHVINFDVPHLPEDYIHRVGRTARANREGDAITFVSPEEEGDLRTIERALGKRIDRAEGADAIHLESPEAPPTEHEQALARPQKPRGGQRRPRSGQSQGGRKRAPRPRAGANQASASSPVARTETERSGGGARPNVRRRRRRRSGSPRSANGGGNSQR